MPLSQPSAPRHPIQHDPARRVETRVHRRARLLTIRPIVPQDANLLALLLDGLAPETRRNRFHGDMRLSSGQLRQLSHVDHRRHLAMVVSTVVDGAEQLIADARYVVETEGDRAEFALVVADGWQGQGVGQWAMQALQSAAMDAGLQWLHGDVLDGNLPMLSLMRRCGFALCPSVEDPYALTAQRRLTLPRPPRSHPQHGLRSWLQRCWSTGLQATAH